jgi:TRAP-type C4-dicarboxylate transport system permease small subunit
MFRVAFGTVPRLVLGTLMLVAVGINFANVVGRYLLGEALFWAEEILVYLVIWGVFVGFAAIAADGAHLNMDLFSSRLPGHWKTAVNALMAAAFVACGAFMIAQSWQVVALFVDAGQVSVAARVPKAVPHAALIFGFALAVLAVVVRIRSYLRGKF